MEASSLWSRLVMLEFILVGSQVQHLHSQDSDVVFIHVSSNRLQHFEYESVTFHCGGADGPLQLRGIKNNETFTPICDVRTTPAGSSCTIEEAYQGDSGEYWCQTGDGGRSNSLNISITAGSVILKSPALPVREGSNVTLSCRNKTSTNLTAHFYKDGRLVDSSSTGDMDLQRVSKAHEGLYRCEISGAGGSPGSWLAVRGLHRETCPHTDPFVYVLLLLRTIFTVVMVALMMLLLGLLHSGKLRVRET